MTDETTRDDRHLMFVLNAEFSSAERIAAALVTGGVDGTAGAFLQSYDPDANDGRGAITLTGKLERAKVFDGIAAVFAEWARVSTKRPLRPDGKPNRPLSAFSIHPVSMTVAIEAGERVKAEQAFLHRMTADNLLRDARVIPGGRYAAIFPKMFTHAIITARLFDETSIEQNWCYHSYEAAKAALDAWDGTGEPTGWHRATHTGDRISESPEEIDGDGKRVGAVGVRYRRG